MKFSTSITAVIAAFLFTSCLSTGSNTFSSSKQIYSGNMIISTDEFEGTNFIEHKDIGVNFTTKRGIYPVSFYIEPTFSTAEDYVICSLQIRSSAIGKNNFFSCSKLIFLGSSEKVTVYIKNKPRIETKSDFMNDYTDTIYSEKLSIVDYERFTNFIINNQKIRLGFYSDNNEVIELKEYGDRAHRIFSDAYSYYKENLKHKTDAAVHANKLDWK